MAAQNNPLLVWGAQVLDLYRMVRFDLRRPHSPTKFLQIKALARRTRSRVLIETGTFEGTTAKRCRRVFNKILTIELDAKLHEAAKQRLARYPNIECVLGDALAKLPELLARPEVSDCLVYLDGHFSGGVTAHGDLAEPACEAIEALAPYQNKINGVIIDDFREFGTAKGYPRRSTLLKAVEDNLGDVFNFTVHMDQVVVWRRSS